MFGVNQLFKPLHLTEIFLMVKNLAQLPPTPINNSLWTTAHFPRVSWHFC